MKIKWKQVEIECTVDEFEDMVASFGLYGMYYSLFLMFFVW